MEDPKIIWLFIIGVFLNFLFYLENLITENTKINELSKLKLTVLVIANGVIGGVIAVTVYYGLVQYFPHINDYLLIGIAGMTAMIGKDGVTLYHKLIKSKAEQR